jgi:hypothetical protein
MEKGALKKVANTVVAVSIEILKKAARLVEEGMVHKILHENKVE